MPATTLTAIGVTLLGGGVVLLLCIVAFQYFLTKQNTNIAPRCSARPPSTIHNPYAVSPSHVQYRCGGNWVKWVMSLSDETLLRGVPGTGTRKDGLEGSLLHVPLDSIVLLRFHALGRKVSLLATFLCLVLLLPLYMTTPKQQQDMGFVSLLSLPPSKNDTGTLPALTNCTGPGDWNASICNDFENKSSSSFTETKFRPKPPNRYRQTTLGNVPNLYYFSENQDSYFLETSKTIQFRLRAAVLVVWLLTIFTFYLLAEEWSIMVGLRRIWYLEQRKGGDSSSSDLESEWISGFSKHQQEKGDDDDDDDDGRSASALSQREERHLYTRHAWIPHPEQPDTVPNIEPYSILIGPLPKPRPFETYEDDVDEHDDLFAHHFPQQLLLQRIVQQLEEQLPQEAGFTSPVCAITVVPTAKDIGPVWRQWYATMMKLRRLLLIEKQLRLLGHDVTAENDIDATTPTSMQTSSIMRESSSPSSSPTAVATGKSSSSVPSMYMQQVFGGTLLDEEWMIQAQQTMGPQQLGAYSRELAQGASNCCPYGCFDGQVRNANLLTLKELHKLQQEQVEYAKEELMRLQKEFMFRPTLVDSDDEEGSDNEDDEEDAALLLTSASRIDSNIRDSKSWKAKNGFFTRKRSFASRCLSPEQQNGNDSDEEEDDNDMENGIELVSPSSSPPTRVTSSGGRRVRRSETGSRWMFNRVTLLQYYHQLKFEVMELLRKYNHPSSWKTLMAKCWKIWEHEDSYAVITFTSRQAAAAARQALSSSGIELNDIPIPPLADAGAFQLLPFRYFCRPVTVTINSIQKCFRLYTALAFLVLMCIFYTIPLTRAANRLDPDTIAYIFPNHEIIASTTGVSLPDLLSGLTTSIIWSLFFMLCPQVFKLMAYFGSNAASLAQAEWRALQYFWWFMVLTAFAGPMLAYWILGALYYKDETLQGGLRKMLLAIAGTTPTTIAATWINWIIYRFTIILPINFLLQFNTHMFSFFGCNCCARITIGGGPGGPTPYRMFVDSGVVLMCCVALGPASPLVAPAALMYFSFCEPLLRRNCIFVYRQRYDDGGLRWTFIFDMIISALVVSQLLMSLQMTLKTAYGCSVFSALAIPTTIYFQWSVKKRYKPSFENTALLRTTLLDGKDSLDDMTLDRREEHRQFLVDAHKAAYIPACIAGTESASVMVDTPAVVVKDRIIDSKGSQDSSDSESVVPPRDPLASSARSNSGGVVSAPARLKPRLKKASSTAGRVRKSE